MQIRVDEIKLTDGSIVNDLVLCQGNQQIRLAVTNPNAVRVAAELSAFIEANTLDVATIVAGKGRAA